MALKMPPLNPLRVFDVAARSKSFTDAATQLFVTQAAVSRQISTLEGYFGVKLFDREQRALTLTAEGRRLHREIGPALDAIGLASDAILRKRDSNVVSIQAYPSIIAQKLIPALRDFTSINTKIELHFLNAIRADEFTFEAADIVIRLGPEMQTDRRGFRFAQDVVVPAASPVIAQSAKREGSFFKTAVLIATKFRHADWPEWAEENHIDIDGSQFVHFENSLLAYQAARRGVGVCMAQEFLLTDDISSGRLSLASGKRLKRDNYYWCLTVPQRRVTRQILVTMDWLESLKVRN